MSEARTSRRASANFEVRTKTASVGDFTEQEARDLSAGGVFLVCADPPRRGTLLRLEFNLEGDGDTSDRIHCVGRVVWVRSEERATPDHPAGMGVKFVRIDDDKRERVEAYVLRESSAVAAAGPGTATGNISYESLPEEGGEVSEAGDSGLPSTGSDVQDAFPSVPPSEQSRPASERSREPARTAGLTEESVAESSSPPRSSGSPASGRFLRPSAPTGDPHLEGRGKAPSEGRATSPPLSGAPLAETSGRRTTLLLLLLLVLLAVALTQFF